jgi:hypothetical protein
MTMIEILNWVGLSLFLAVLAGLLLVRFKHPPNDKISRRVSNALFLIVLGSIIGLLPRMAGASEAIMVAGSLVSMAMTVVAVTLVLYRKRGA